MSIYEFTFIAQQGLTQYEVEGLVKGLSSLLSKMDSTVIKYESWGLRDLAYPMRKMNKAYYVMMYISAEGHAIQEFLRKVKYNEDIIRFLCIKKEKVDEGDSFMIQSAS